MDIIAEWDFAEVTVIFLNYDDEVLQETTVLFGDEVEPPTDPSREFWTFTGWDRPLVNGRVEVDEEEEIIVRARRR